MYNICLSKRLRMLIILLVLVLSNISNKNSDGERGVPVHLLYVTFVPYVSTKYFIPLPFF